MILKRDRPAGLLRMMAWGSLALSLLFALTLTGCDTDTGDLSVSTIEWELGGDGFVQFYTNDAQYYEYSFWKLYENLNGSTYKIECKKISGSRSHSYGMVFGASNLVTNQFYCVVITASGSYGVFKNNGGTYTTLKDWATTDKLYTGYNQINVIKVTQSGTTYTVYLNNSQVYQFTDASITGGRVGYHVSIGEQEDESFPNTPVDIRFRQP